MSDEEDHTFFTVIGAKDLKSDADLGTFVTVSMGSQMLFRTRSEIGELPQWNETHPIPGSGPRSFSIAIHREAPTGDTLLGEIQDIIINSGPPVLTLPIEPLTGRRPIIITVSIRRLGDMPILGGEVNDYQRRLLCMSDFIVKPISVGHPDLPDGARISMAIIVNGNSLYETTPAEKERSDSHWSCNGKVIVSNSMAYTLEVICDGAPRKRLGFVQLMCDDVENKEGVELMVQHTNNDLHLDILFSATVLGQGISNALFQVVGSATQGPQTALSDDDVPDLQETSWAIMDSASSHVNATLGVYNPDGIPGCHTISAAVSENQSGVRLYVLGCQLLARFKSEGSLPCLEGAISTLHDAVQHLPEGHQDQALYFYRLATALVYQFQHLRKLPDINDAIGYLERSASLFADRDPSKMECLDALGQALWYRLQREGDISDLDKAISALENAIKLSPTGHPNKVMYLNKLGSLYHKQFMEGGTISDLEKAICVQENAVELIPTGHPDKAMYLNNLGGLYQYQFDSLGEVSDLEKGISLLENAVALNPNEAIILNTLGGLFQSRFVRLGEISDLQEAISAKEKAIELMPIGDPDKAMYLTNLGNSYGYQFNRLGEISDLEKAISAQEDAVELTPTGHPNKAICLNNLGNSYQKQFVTLGEFSALEKAISALENAVNLTPPGHPNKAACLSNLGNSYQSQFARVGEISGLAKAISAFENAVELTQTGHPNKAMYLSNLGNCYQIQFERLGQVSYLEKAISTLENAAALTPTGHPHIAMCLASLGTSYQARFEWLGEISDLDKAISAQKRAVSLTPTGHPNTAVYVTNLGNSYLKQFETLGEISALEQAISALESAVDLTPPGHPNKAGYFNNLGSIYHSRFRRLGEIADLEKAISALGNAVDLTPPGHPNKAACLSNLGNSYQIQFQRLGEISDLEKAISTLENAVDLTPAGHPNRSMSLTTLGGIYMTHFECSGEISDLAKAILALENAVELNPTGHPHTAVYLTNLGNSYQSQYETLGEISDLEKAVSVHEDAVELAPTGHPNTAIYLSNLGNSYINQFERLGDLPAITKAIYCFSQAAQSSTSPPLICFQGALLWVKCNEIAGLSPIEAYDNAIHLLPHVAWIGLSILHRYSLLSDISKVVNDAAAVAISSGQYEVALEWLEQGRSIVWGQLLHLRTPLIDELFVKEPDLATQILAVSQNLDKASIRETDTESSLSVESVAQKHHLLASQWDNMIHQVRLVPGFERFMHPKTISQLIPAAQWGPIITLIIHKTGCHALILTTTVIHIPLPNFSYEKAQDMHSALKRLYKSRFVRQAVFEHEIQTSLSTFEEILSDLWSFVVLPVLDGLAFSVCNNGNLPHIWWCPTGPLVFLPIHAAGLYTTDEPGHKLSDFAISSYTPTITTLLNIQHNLPSTSTTTFKILAVAQETNHNQSHLFHTNTEVENLKKCAGLLNVEILKGAQATVDNVVQKMSDSTWVHLACHGTQNPSNPTKSAFILANGNLDLSRITKMSLPQAEFAFLSACQTAAGDVLLQEEAVHLAAGMLMAGYQSVVATMWAIRDEDGPLVVDDVYTEILRNGQPDYTQAAYALHHATQKLRRSGAPFLSWVPFIHLGR